MELWNYNGTYVVLLFLSKNRQHKQQEHEEKKRELGTTILTQLGRGEGWLDCAGGGLLWYGMRAVFARAKDVAGSKRSSWDDSKNEKTTASKALFRPIFLVGNPSGAGTDIEGKPSRSPPAYKPTALSMCQSASAIRAIYPTNTHPPTHITHTHSKQT